MQSYLKELQLSWVGETAEGARTIRRHTNRVQIGEKYDYTFKFIIIGDTGTGKSCILHQFVEGKGTSTRT